MRNTDRKSPGVRKGFTLIELMVVLLIIALLSSILIPAVNQARTAAKTAQSKVLINTLDAAVYQYRSTEKLDQYPLSFAETADIGNPYNAPNQTAPDMPSTDFTAWGAQLLVWALAGADVLGTPGFSEPLDELYALDVSGDPVRQRPAPFVDISKINIRPVTKTPVRITGMLEGAVPVFVDAFNMPILYYKADTTREDIYRYIDNQGLTFDHPIHGQPNLDAAFEDPRLASFSGHPGPYNRDSFILLSSGADMQYGTSDDLANFER